MIKCWWLRESGQCAYLTMTEGEAVMCGFGTMRDPPEGRQDKCDFYKSDKVQKRRKEHVSLLHQ